MDSEQKNLDSRLNTIYKAKDDLVMKQEEREGERLRIAEREEDIRRKAISDELRKEDDMRARQSKELSVHEKRAEELLQKQLDMRKQNKDIAKTLQAVYEEKQKVQREIAYADKMAREERDNSLQWEKKETSKLDYERKYLTAETEKRR